MGGQVDRRAGQAKGVRAVIPNHWAFRGPQIRQVRPAHEVVRQPNVAGAHLSSFRRLVRIGPWAIYFGRYRPGTIDPQTARTGRAEDLRAVGYLPAVLVGFEPSWYWRTMFAALIFMGASVRM